MRMHHFLAGACMPEEIKYTGSEERSGVSGERISGASGERIVEYSGGRAGGGEMRSEKRISWPAVFGGAMVALGTMILFLLFGLAIAFMIGRPGGVGAWSVIWYLVTAIVSLYLGGWVASRLSGYSDRDAAQLHGLVTWGLTTLATALFLTSSAWNILSTSAGLLAAAVTRTPQGQAAAAEAARRAGQATTGYNYQSYMENFTSSGWMFALILFLGVLLSAIASWLGGAKGARSSYSHTPTTPTATTRL
jgi:MFS family permease